MFGVLPISRATLAASWHCAKRYVANECRKPFFGPPAIWHTALEAPEPGTWRVTATHRDRELQGLAETRDLVVRSESGLKKCLDLSGDLPNLNRLAKAGGLWAGTLDRDEHPAQGSHGQLKPRHQERREAIRFWSSYLSMTLVVTLLCVEWVLRKRLGLP